MTEYKTCRKCGQDKPFTDYYKGSGTFGLRSQCKLCINEANNSARQSNPEKYRHANLAYYYKNKNELNKARRANWPKVWETTKNHRLAKDKQYRQQNPDKIAGIARRRRATKRANGWERYTEAQVLELHGAVCHICGDPIDLSLNRKIGTEGWEMSLHIDHVIPISKGGPDKLSNVKPSHGKCNLKKRANLLGS